MTIPNNGQFARRFTENSSHYTGNKTSSPGSLNSQMTQQRTDAMQQIYDLANKKGINVDDVVTKVLTNSDAVLQNYIQSKGEVPVSDPVGRAVQATLLRASDVATTASILDLSDEDALKTIEAAESDMVDNNSPEISSLLDIPSQGAIACAMQHMSQTSGKRMGQILNGVQNLASNVQAKANNDDGSGDISSWLDWTDGSGTAADPTQTDASVSDVTLSPASVGSSLASIPVDSSVSVANLFPTVSTSASTAVQASPNTSSGGVLNSLTGILTGITQVASQVTSAANAVSASGSAIQKAAGGVGASSIQQYVQNNGPMLIIILVVILLVIWFAIRGKK